MIAKENAPKVEGVVRSERRFVVTLAASRV
jgi:hypothetical protein